MKVTVIDTKTGKEKSMAPRFAKILTGIGRATYLTRDMVAAPAPSVAAPAPAPATAPPLPAPRFVTVEGEQVAIDGLALDALRAIAEKLEVKVHHAAGAEKVRTALVESQIAPKE